MPELFNVYVIWLMDGPIFTSLLQYEDTDEQRQCMTHWSSKDYVEQAWDSENTDNEEPNPIVNGATFEVAAIFESPTVKFIY